MLNEREIEDFALRTQSLEGRQEDFSRSDKSLAIQQRSDESVSTFSCGKRGLLLDR